MAECGKIMTIEARIWQNCVLNLASGTWEHPYRYIYLKCFLKIKKDAKHCYNVTIGKIVNKFNDLRLLQWCYNCNRLLQFIHSDFPTRARKKDFSNMYLGKKMYYGLL